MEQEILKLKKEDIYPYSQINTIALANLERWVVERMAEILVTTNEDIMANFLSKLLIIKEKYKRGDVDDFSYDLIRNLSKELERLGSPLCN